MKHSLVLALAIAVPIVGCSIKSSQPDTREMDSLALTGTFLSIDPINNDYVNLENPIDSVFLTFLSKGGLTSIVYKIFKPGYGTATIRDKMIKGTWVMELSETVCEELLNDIDSLYISKTVPIEISRAYVEDSLRNNLDSKYYKLDIFCNDRKQVEQSYGIITQVGDSVINFSGRYKHFVMTLYKLDKKVLYILGKPEYLQS